MLGSFKYGSDRLQVGLGADEGLSKKTTNTVLGEHRPESPVFIISKLRPSFAVERAYLDYIKYRRMSTDGIKLQAFRPTAQDAYNSTGCIQLLHTH